MSIEIDVGTVQATGAVEALTKKIDDVGKSVETLTGKFSQLLGRSAAAEVAALRKEFDSWRKQMEGVANSVKPTADKVKELTGSLGQTTEGLKKTRTVVTGVTQDLNKMASAADKTVKAAKEQASAIHAATQAERDAADAAKKLAESSDFVTRAMQKGSNTQYAKQMRDAAAAAKELVASEKLVADAMQRGSNTQFAKQMRDAAAAAKQAEAELARVNKAMQSGSNLQFRLQMKAAAEAEKLAAAEARELAKEEKKLDEIIGRATRDAATFKEQLLLLNKAKREGRITSDMHAAGMKNAAMQFREAHVSSLLAGTGINKMTLRMRAGEQAAAAFRASMMGAGLSFGIFTGSTIAAATAAYTFAKSIAYTIKTGASFEQTFNRTQIVMGLFGDTLTDMSDKGKRTRDDVELVRLKILQLGRDTQFTSGEVAEASKVLAQAGLEGIQIYNALPGALNLAAIGAMDVAQAADIATNVMYTFAKSGKGVSDTSREFSKTVDILATTSISANLTIQQLAKTLQYTGTIANQSGMSLTQTATAVGVLANAGIKGSQAGTILRRVITELAPEGSKANQVLSDLGVTVVRAEDGSLNLAETFKNLAHRMEGMDRGQKIAKLREAFGLWATAGSAGMVLLADNLDKIGLKLEDVTGKAEAMRIQLQNSVKGAAENLQSVIEYISISAFQGFGDDLKKQLQDLAGYLRANSTEFAQGIARSANAVVQLIKGILEWRKAIEFVILSYAGLKVAQGALSLVAKLTANIKVITAEYATKKAAEAVAIQASTEALALNTRAMSANAAATLAAGRATAVNFSQVSVNTAGMSAGMVAAGKAGAEMSSKMVSTAVAGGLLARALAGIGAAISGLGLVALIGSVVYGLYELYEGFKKPVDAIDESSAALREYELIASRLAEASIPNLTQVQSGLREELAATDVTVSEKLKELQDAEKNLASLKTQYASGVYSSSSNLGVSLHAGPAKEAAALKELTDASERAAAATKQYNLVLDKRTQLHGALETVTAQSIVSQVEERYGLEKTTELMKQAEANFVSFAAAIGISSGSLGDFNHNLEVALDRLKVLRDQEEADAEGRRRKAEADAEAKAALQEHAQTLSQAISLYQKQSDTVAGLALQMGSFDKAMRDLNAGTEETSKVLQKMGYTAEQAAEALKYAQQDAFFEHVLGIAGQLNPALANLKDVYKLLNKDTRTAVEIWDQLLASIVRQHPEYEALANALNEKVRPAVEAASNGTAEAIKQWDALLESQAKLRAEFEGDDGRQAFIDFLVNAGVATADTAANTIEYVHFVKEFGDVLKENESPVEKWQRSVQELNNLYGRGAITLQVYLKWLAKLGKSSPLKQMSDSVKYLKGLVAATAQGEAAVAAYNAQWNLLGPNMDKAAGPIKDMITDLSNQEEALRATQKVMEDINNTPFRKLRNELKALRLALDMADKLQLSEEAVKALQNAITGVKLEMATGIVGMAAEGMKSLQSLSEEGSKEYERLGKAAQALSIVEGILAVVHQATAGDVYTAIPRMIAVAAMIAQMVDGFHGPGGGMSAADRQRTQGTGTVLGDSDAKSESIMNAVQITADATSALVGINRNMLNALIQLRDNIGSATNMLAHGAGRAGFDALPQAQRFRDWFAGGLFSSLPLDPLNILGGSSQVTDQGIILGGGGLSDVNAGAYQNSRTRSWRFGSWHNRSQTVPLPDDVSAQFQLIVDSIVDSVQAAAEALGLLPDDIQQAIDEFQLEVTRISLMDLSAEDQQAQLLAVFSSIFDNLAADVVPFIEQFQRVGEGLGETLVRVATGVQVMREALHRLGFALDVTDPEQFAQISEGLIDLVGGVNEFITAMETFVDKFASREHQFALVQSDFSSAMQDVGLSIPATRDGFWQLMQSLDASTESGRNQIATLLRLTDIADEYYSELERQADELAQALEDQRQALDDYIDLVMDINGQLREFDGASDFQHTLQDLAVQYRNNVDELNRLARAAGLSGARVEDLARAEMLHAQQMARAIAQLEQQARELVNTLGYSPLAMVDAEIAALQEQENAAANSIRDFGNAITDTAQAANDAVNLLLGDLSPLKDKEKLQLALDAQRKGQIGPEEVLQIGKRLFASGADYNRLFYQVMEIGDRRQQDSGPATVSTTVRDTVSAAMQALLDKRNAILDEQNQQQRFLQASQLAQMIADLAGARGEDFATIAESLGMTGLDQLLGDLHLENLDALDTYLHSLQANSYSLEDLVGSITAGEQLIVDTLHALFDIAHLKPPTGIGGSPGPDDPYGGKSVDGKSMRIDEDTSAPTREDLEALLEELQAMRESNEQLQQNSVELQKQVVELLAKIARSSEETADELGSMSRDSNIGGVVQQSRLKRSQR